MKKTIYSIAAFGLALFASCSEDMLEKNTQQQNSNEISFAIAKTLESRGVPVTTENLFTDSTYSEMQVVAFEGGDYTAPYFTDNLSLDGEVLKTDLIHYWPASGGALDFFVKPNSEGISSESFASGSYTFHYKAPVANAEEAKDGENTEDLVFAYATESEGTVNLQFKHALTRINFKYTTPLSYHKIDKITISGAYTEGDCSFNNGAFSWTEQKGSAILSQNCEHKIITANQEFGGTDTDVATFMLIPGAKNDNEMITFTVEMDNQIYSEENPAPSVTINHSELEPGKTLTIEMNDNSNQIFITSGAVGATKRYEPVRDASGNVQSYNLTLESWVTAQKVVTQKPADIAILVDVSGSMDEQMTGGKRMKITQDAIKTFVDNVAAKNGDYYLSLVKFAGEKIAENEGNDTYNWNYNYTQVVKNWTTGYDDFKNKVGSLSPNGPTAVDSGLEVVKSLFTNRVDNRDNAAKILILITDGEPNHYSGFDIGVANEAVNSANSLKDDNVIIYTVYVGDKASTNAANYLKAVSSNYKNASYKKNKNGNYEKQSGVYVIEGNEIAGSNFYVNATDPSQLNQVFETALSGIPTDLDESTEVRDIFSSAFELPTLEGQNSVNVTLSTIKCTGVDENGNVTSWGTVDKNDSDLRADGVTVGITTDGILSVTGFNYKENYCGYHDNKIDGVKLRIVISGLIPKDLNSGIEYLTNGYGSGIYSGDEMVVPFVKEDNPNEPIVITK